MSKRADRNHTKSGPGRYHGQGAMFAGPNETRIVREARKQYAVSGGFHAGKPYLSYAEHDQCVRAALAGTATDYAMTRQQIIAAR